MKSKKQALEDAWKIHDAQLDWTGKVDAKATFAFGFVSAIIVAVGALVAAGRVFSAFHHWWLWALFFLGLLFMAVSVTLAALVVSPRLRSSGLKESADVNFIYFGHARYWSGRRLSAALRKEDLLDQLSRQIVVMAEIAWAKHLRVGQSILFGVLGGLLLVICAFLTRIP